MNRSKKGALCTYTVFFIKMELKTLSNSIITNSVYNLEKGALCTFTVFFIK